MPRSDVLSGRGACRHLKRARANLGRCVCPFCFAQKPWIFRPAADTEMAPRTAALPCSVGAAYPSTKMPVDMLVCASIISRPIDPKGNKKINSGIMQRNYAGFAHLVVAIVDFLARQRLPIAWSGGCRQNRFRRYRRHDPIALASGRRLAEEHTRTFNARLARLPGRRRSSKEAQSRPSVSKISASACVPPLTVFETATGRDPASLCEHGERRKRLTIGDSQRLGEPWGHHQGEPKTKTDLSTDGAEGRR